MSQASGSSSMLARLIPHRRGSRTPTSPSTPDEAVPSNAAAGPSSKVISSCEIFSLFKTLASGKPANRRDVPAATLEDSASPDTTPSLERLSIDTTQQDYTTIPSSASSPPETPSTPARSTMAPTTPEPEVHISDEAKVKAIQEEYGNIAATLENADGAQELETLITETKGSMFRGVMIVGNLHLTSHRLLFHALLPPDEAFVRHYDSSEEWETLGTAPISKAHVLHAGPVTWHKSSPLAPAQRVWFELNADMITTYPSADEAGRVRPIKSILLSTIHRLHPFEEARPADLHLTYEVEKVVHHVRLTVDTVQSAAQWRRNIEAALFRVMRSKWRETAARRQGHSFDEGDQWSTLRYCVPLDRAKIMNIEDYHDFATLVGLRVSLDEPQNNFFHADLAAHGDFHAASQLKPEGVLPRVSTDCDLPEQEPGPHFSFNIALLREQTSFIDALQRTLDTARQRRVVAGAARHRMSLTIAGFDCLTTDEEQEEAKAGSMNLAESLTAKAARKAEKAHLAAKVFGLHEEEGIWLKRCYVDIANVPVRGHLIITPQFVCFWRRNTISPDIKYRFERSIIKGSAPVDGIQPGFSGLALKLHGRHDLNLEFWNKGARDETVAKVDEMLQHEAIPAIPLTPQQSPSPSSSTPSTPHPSDILLPTKKSLFQTRTFPDDFLSHMPFIANKPWLSRSIALAPRTFTMLTIGSRGDVQPYIALGLRLKQDGHRVVIVTHDEFKEWIQSYGLEHRQAGGDPTALMKLSTEHKMLSPGFFKESIGSFRQWLDDLLVDAWEACKDADVLIESPSAMAGIHIAEALKIPYFRAFTMPWTRTTAYPQAFMVPAFEMGPSFNYSTYVLYDNIIWKATAGQINRWRKHYLMLPSTDQSALSPTKVPFLYNFSSAVVPKPLDWHDDITITGYWVLENSDADWTPPPALDAFMEKAKADGKPLVYIGFGSIVVPKPNAVTKGIIEAVEKADVRAIIAKGWSSRGGDPAKEGQEIKFPASCFALDKVPHGWLFPRVQAALHHGGAGTVGASLRAGVPTLINPFFGDQNFWAIRVTKLGVGLRVASLRADDIAEALTKATSDRIMIEKASRIGQAIRKESGVDNALEAIHYNILRAGSDRTKMAWAK